MESKSRSPAIFFTKLIIILIFAGFVFFVGWSQFKVGVNEVGFISSKTSGLSSELIENGKFSWHWELLLPTNVTLMKFSLGNRNYSKDISGELPASDIYLSVFEKDGQSENVDFTYQVKVDVSCFVSRDNIQKLVKERIVDSEETLSTYISDAVTQYTTALGNAIIKKAFDTEKSTGFFFESDLNNDSIIKSVDFAQKYPYITITKTAIHDVKMPSFTLYIAARKKYFDSSNFLDNLGAKAQ